MNTLFLILSVGLFGLSLRYQDPSWKERTISVSMHTQSPVYDIEIMKISIIEEQIIVFAVVSIIREENGKALVPLMEGDIADEVTIYAPESYPEKIYVLANPWIWGVEYKYNIVKSRKPVLEYLDTGTVLFDKTDQKNQES